MKRILLPLLVLLLTGAVNTQAATEKVYADFSNPTMAGDAQWDATTQTLSWTQAWNNQMRNLGLPTGDLTKYEKIVVDCSDLNAKNFRILIYKGSNNKQFSITQEGVTELVFSDLIAEGTIAEADLKDVTEVVLSGGNQDANGSVHISSLYLETYDDGTIPLKDPELAFTADRVQIAPGEEFTAPTLLNPFDVAPITYSVVSQPEGLVTVDAGTGSVTLADGEGRAIVTASFGGNDEYKAAEATYTLIVKQPVDIGDGHWVGTWATAPMEAGSNNNPPSPGLANNSLRQIVQVSIGGDVVRLKLTNHFGNSPVEIKGVELAVAKTAGSNANIDETTTTMLTFDGSPSTTIAAGKMAVTDAVRFAMTPRQNIAITIHYGNASSTVVSSHPGSRTTSYLANGNTSNFTSAAKTDHWYHILALETIASEEAGCVAVLGNSITDGRGSTTNQQDRWTDAFSRCLLANDATNQLGVLNLGIGGNCVLRGGLGPTALARYQRDLFEQEGVKYIILFEGVNDLGGSQNGVLTARQIIDTWKQIIRQAHAKGIRVIGATVTPFKNNSYFSTDHEAGRQKLNQWILKTAMLDGVIDFASAVCDKNDSEKLDANYLFENDWLHLNAKGYKVMGECIDLSLFAQTGPLAADDEADEEEVEGIWIEAENLKNGIYGGNFLLGEDPMASNGKYLETVNGLTAQSSDKADQLLAEFTTDEAATYYVYARLMCPSYDDDSYFVSMDGGQWNMVNGLFTGGSWDWLQIFSGYLSTGRHQLGICAREDGARMDKLCITSSPTPPVTMGGADTTTGIMDGKRETTSDSRYFDLQGRQRTRLHRGLNIVRKSNNETVKIVY